MITPLIEAIAKAIKGARALPGTSPVARLSDVDRRAAQAALTAITEAGFSIVPNEPTEAMIDAGCAAYWPISEFATGSLTNGERTTQCYRAMIAATNNGKAD